MGVLEPRYSIIHKAIKWYHSLDASDPRKKWDSDSIKIRKMNKTAKKAKPGNSIKRHKVLKVSDSIPLGYAIVSVDARIA